jgi:hypothetical protein
MYFFFNESNKAESRVATIAGHGNAQAWDLATGEIHPMLGATVEGDSVKVPLFLGPYEAKVIVVGPLPKGVAGSPEPSFATGEPFVALDGDWKLDLKGKQLTTPLKPWEELGTASFAGPATYSRQFTADKAPKGKHVYLEIADVHDYAKVTLNVKDLGACSWQPYRWDVTDALKKGANDLTIEVSATVAGRGGPGGPPPAAAPAAAAGAGPAGSAGAAGAAGAGARRRPTGAAGAAGAAGAPAAGTPPAGYGAAGGGRAPAPPPTSGMLGSVKLVVH